MAAYFSFLNVDCFQWSYVCFWVHSAKMITAESVAVHGNVDKFVCTKHLNKTTCQSSFAWVLLRLFDLQCSSCLPRRFAIDGLRSAKILVMLVLLSSWK